MTRCGRCQSKRKTDNLIDGLCSRCKREADSQKIADTTLLELRSAYSVSQYHAKIRGAARSAYRGPWSCEACGYDLHVDVCHVRDVAEFSPDASLREVNAPSNLVTLCKNHHWEFDNGYVTVRGITKPKVVRKRLRCEDCQKPISRNGTRCRTCAAANGRGYSQHQYRDRIEWPPTEVILEMLAGSNWSAVGRSLGVSGRSVKNRVSKYPVETANAE